MCGDWCSAEAAEITAGSRGSVAGVSLSAEPTGLLGGAEVTSGPSGRISRGHRAPQVLMCWVFSLDRREWVELFRESPGHLDPSERVSSACESLRKCTHLS